MQESGFSDLELAPGNYRVLFLQSCLSCADKLEVLSWNGIPSRRLQAPERAAYGRSRCVGGADSHRDLQVFIVMMSWDAALLADTKSITWPMPLNSIPC